jgi:hypothetical protein
MPAGGTTAVDCPRGGFGTPPLTARYEIYPNLRYLWKGLNSGDVQSRILSETPGRFAHRAPMLGEHTDEILAELGYSKAAIDALRAANVI